LKAVSPVIATIIIVSVAIVMSIAITYWMLGIGTTFTRYEKLEFISAYTDGNYTIHIVIKNTGSASLYLSDEGLFLNGKQYDAYNNTVQPSWTEMTLESGDKTEEIITLTKGEFWTSGMTVMIVLRTGSGGEYPKTVQLP